MILLITGAITPAKNIAKTTLIDSNKRKDQYITALKKMIKRIGRVNEMNHSANENEAVRKIGVVYCDNSNPESITFEELKKYANDKHVKLEILSFKGNEEKIMAQGKGYGEGEITAYALANSQLIKEDGYFMKLTGRLMIDNLSSIVKKISSAKIYFNIPNHTMKGIADTRFYAMPVKVYNDYFSTAYEKVDDNNGYYYEHAFTDVIRTNKLKTSNFPEYPLYSGESGSSGGHYTYKPWKSKIKNVLSLFQFYKVK